MSAIHRAVSTSVRLRRATESKDSWEALPDLQRTALSPVFRWCHGKEAAALIHKYSHDDARPCGAATSSEQNHNLMRNLTSKMVFIENNLAHNFWTT